MTKTYAKQSIAKQMATKAAKKTGKVYEVVFVEGGGWTYREVLPKVRKPSRTNVVGRCSGGNWLLQALKFLEAQGIDRDAVTITRDEKRVWVGDATRPRMFWFFKPERAEAVVARLTV